MLAATHPEVAFRDCRVCLAFMFNEDGRPALFRGEMVPRGKLPPPCQTGAGCPKGSPDATIALSKRNAQAVRFHRRCEAVGHWPEDAMVAHNAAIIRAADADADRILGEQHRARRQREGDRRQLPEGHRDQRAADAGRPGAAG